MLIGLMGEESTSLSNWYVGDWRAEMDDSRLACFVQAFLQEHCRAHAQSSASSAPSCFSAMGMTRHEMSPGGLKQEDFT